MVPLIPRHVVSSAAGRRTGSPTSAPTRALHTARWFTRNCQGARRDTARSLPLLVIRVSWPPPIARCRLPAATVRCPPPGPSATAAALCVHPPSWNRGMPYDRFPVRYRRARRLRDAIDIRRTTERLAFRTPSDTTHRSELTQIQNVPGSPWPTNRRPLLRRDFRGPNRSFLSDGDRLRAGQRPDLFGALSGALTR